MKVLAAGLAICLAFVGATAAAASAKPPKKCTLLQLDLGLEGTPVAAIELNGVVTAGQPNPSQGGAALANAWGDGGAKAAVELDLTGPDAADAVLFFISSTPGNAVRLRVQEAYMETQLAVRGNAALAQGAVPGFTAQQSLLWTITAQNASGQPTGATVAAVAVGRVNVEGVAAGTTPPDPATPAALAEWGVNHLARVVKLSRCKL